MRVNPDYVNNLVNSLDQVTTNQQNLTEELSTGVKVNALSDNPTAAGENVLLTSQINLDDTFSQTSSSTENMLNLADSALGSVITQLNSAISLATEANNGTLNSTNLQSITTSLTGIRDEVLSLANTTYLGQYIFAGSQSGAPPFSLNSGTSPAVASYNGDEVLNFVQTPNGQSIQTNVPGDQIFLSSTGGNVLNTLNQLIADYSSGTPSSTAAADTTQLTQALSTVSQQRVVLDNSITRLTAAGNYSQVESTQLLSEQNTLLQADPAQVATQLSMAETQQAALTQVITAVDQQPNLFSQL